MPEYKVGHFVGSFSSTSVNRELSQVLMLLAPADLAFTSPAQLVRAGRPD